MPGVARFGILEWNDGQGKRRYDQVVVEEPLEIRLIVQPDPQGPPRTVPISVTMRTPGHDFELAVGLLFTEGVLRSREDVAQIRYCADPGVEQRFNVVSVWLRPGVDVDVGRLSRHFYTASSCGVCGKASLDAIRLRGIAAPNPRLRLDPQVLCSFPEELRRLQALFSRTGGLHAAALFDARGRLLQLREDVGRHNAVDKLVGWALLAGRVPLGECALMVSGRAGFEIAQKALAAGVPILVSVSAPSSLAVELAHQFGLTLVGFLRERRFNVYAGEERLGLSQQLESSALMQRA